jgi:hypothetical protein
MRLAKKLDWKGLIQPHSMSQNCGKLLLARPRLSVGMELLCSHSIDFHENLYLRIYGKSIDKIQVSLKSDSNSRCFT